MVTPTSRRQFWDVAPRIGPPVPKDDNDPQYRKKALEKFGEAAVGAAHESIAAMGITSTHRRILAFLEAEMVANFQGSNLAGERQA